MREKEPTPEQLQNYFDRLLAKFKKDPQYELKQEFGTMLMRHIDSFSESELARYNELKTLLKQPIKQ